MSLEPRNQKASSVSRVFTIMGIWFAIACLASCHNGHFEEERTDSVLNEVETAELLSLVTSHNIAYVAVSETSACHVLNTPDRVHLLYEKKPMPTLRLLRSIVASGKASDSLNAAALAIAAGDETCSLGIFAMDVTKYDVIDAQLGKTWRTIFITMIDRRIRDQDAGAEGGE